MTEALIDLMSEVSHRFQQRLRDEVQAAGIELTHFEAKALATIARLPGSTQQMVAARMGCDKAQLGRAIKVLEERSLVVRKVSADDWRARDLMLTPGGAAIFGRIMSHRAAIAQECLAHVSADERDRLSSTLMKIVVGLRSQPEGG